MHILHAHVVTFYLVVCVLDPNLPPGGTTSVRGRAQRRSAEPNRSAEVSKAWVAKPCSG